MTGKLPAVTQQDFTAVVLVGHGEHLFPFNEGPNVLSKALLPIGNVAVINIVLNWILESGLLEILLIVPPSNYPSISNHLSEHYSASTHPRLNLILKKYTDGERDEDDISANGSTGEHKPAAGVEGTARLLKRFRNIIRNDFVILPCDLVPPSYLKLSRILDKHRSSPEAVLTSVLYDPPDIIREVEEPILTAYDKYSGELLLLQNMDNLDENLELRSSLIKQYPTLSLSMRLLDSHIYVCRRSILDLLASRRPRDLDSLKVQVIPWLVKGSWQKGLSEQWCKFFCDPEDDIFAKALNMSTTATVSKKSTLGDISGNSPQSPISMSEQEDLEKSFHSSVEKENRKASSGKWHCQALIVRPTTTGSSTSSTNTSTSKTKDKAKSSHAEPEHFMRANTLAGYWEINRRLIKTLNITNPSSSNIHATSQWSLNGLMGDHTKIGERCSIDKSIIGRHCVIGKGARLSGCILWDYAIVEENAKLENVILCNNVRIGANAHVKDCEFGPGYQVEEGASIKGERLVVGQEA